MPNYRRAFLKGGTFFFTVVTFERYPIFKDEPSVNLLRHCFRSVIETHPFKMDAIVILPDHLHTIWTLPDNECDFSIRWKLTKGAFSQQYTGFKAEVIPESMLKKNEQGIWQRRFWEHAIRDQEDFNRHCDYIHYNPVKHGLVNSPAEWKHSSFKKFVEQGLYAQNWGQGMMKELLEMDFE
ncbi:MAG: transposase [Dehalococcoidia bacterium]|nr:transposase [Dehalococcoidia bacterium]